MIRQNLIKYRGELRIEIYEYMNKNLIISDSSVYASNIFL